MNVNRKRRIKKRLQINLGFENNRFGGPTHNDDKKQSHRNLFINMPTVFHRPATGHIGPLPRFILVSKAIQKQVTYCIFSLCVFAWKLVPVSIVLFAHSSLNERITTARYCYIAVLYHEKQIRRPASSLSQALFSFLCLRADAKEKSLSSK